jgi:hypothetical protein
MEYCKKLILMEPRMLEQLQEHTEYKDIQKEPDKKKKSQLSLHMQSILDDETLTDDVKVKRYQETLRKFINVANKLPEIHHNEGISSINSFSEIHKPRHTARQLTTSKRRTPNKRAKRLTWVQ